MRNITGGNFENGTTAIEQELQRVHHHEGLAIEREKRPPNKVIRAFSVVKTIALLY